MDFLGKQRILKLKTGRVLPLEPFTKSLVFYDSLSKKVRRTADCQKNCWLETNRHQSGTIRRPAPLACLPGAGAKPLTENPDQRQARHHTVRTSDVGPHAGTSSSQSLRLQVLNFRRHTSQLELCPAYGSSQSIHPRLVGLPTALQEKVSKCT